MTRLRSIPSANRRPGGLACLSSMRAATRVGLVFVGGAARRTPADDGSGATSKKARVIQPNRQAQREREAFQRALAAKVRQLEKLVAEAASPEEVEFWRMELDRLVGGGG